jgi:beta-N-acetylhexosaminidase
MLDPDNEGSSWMKKDRAFGSANTRDTPQRNESTPIRWFVVLTLVMGVLALGGAFARYAPSTYRPSTPSSGSPASISGLPPGPPVATSEGRSVEQTAPSKVPANTPISASVPPTLAWQPSAMPSDANLEAVVSGMSLQDRVAQMLIVGFHGQSIANSSELATLVGTYHIGGVVLLEANAHDPQQLSALTAELQSLAGSSGAGLPLFIAINHEGGIVVRITDGVTGFPGNMAVAATGQPEYAYISAALAARELRAMGINMNLAPVLDVNDNPLNPVIGVRSFGETPSLVADCGRLAIRGSQENGVIAVAKHFPGHGSVAVDSHGWLPVLEATADELMQHELVPFAAAIEQDVGSIMTAHVAVPALDASGRPATLSSQVLMGLLRQEMGYDGLIMTDSLGMASVSSDRSQAEAAVEAVQAGADVVLSTTPMEAHVATFEALVAAVQQGEIPVEQIDQSVLRILRVKHTYGLFASQMAPIIEEVGSSEYQRIANEIALQAVTLLRDDSGNIPLPAPPARLLVISPNHLPFAVSQDSTVLAELLRERGYEVDEIVFNLDSDGSRDYVSSVIRPQVPMYDSVIFGEWELIKRYVNWGDQWQEKLITDLSQSNAHLIVVAWHNPAAILRCPHTTTFLTAYGNTHAQVAAVVAALTGEQVPSGRLPITLPEVTKDE